MYGITETTVHTTYREIERADTEFYRSGDLAIPCPAVTSSTWAAATIR
ncbi:hypothetical protein QWJ26_02830 [Streptomyces sp. CSDS2]|nr:hypothetical protein [Streptomyces sp. CSDS2]MDN3258759.1 hypothetical protein [Streptomyces sp. CSDS2]